MKRCVTPAEQIDQQVLHFNISVNVSMLELYIQSDERKKKPPTQSTTYSDHFIKHRSFYNLQI